MSLMRVKITDGEITAARIPDYGEEPTDQLVEWLHTIPEDEWEGDDSGIRVGDEVGEPGVDYVVQRRRKWAGPGVVETWHICHGTSREIVTMGGEALVVHALELQGELLILSDTDAVIEEVSLPEVEGAPEQATGELQGS